jgi:flagellar motor switch protein FliM
MLKAFRDGDGVATERVRAFCDREEFTLNDAQFVLAREYGFGSWPNLVASLETPPGVTRMSRPQLFTIEHLHDKCCRPLGEGVFSHHLGEKAVCETIFLDQTTYAEFVGSLSRPACLCSFGVGAMQSRAVLDVTVPLALALLGKGADEDGWLTEEDKRRMAPVFQQIL